MNNEQILSALHWRYATKKYDSSKKVSEQDLATLKESLRLTPSSFGLQPWKFLIVHNKDIQKKLREVSWGQSIIEDCSHLVVFTAMRTMPKEHIARYIKSTAEARGLPNSALEGYQSFMEQAILPRTQEDLMGWNRRQVYIALGFLLQTAALLKVDATPIEGIEPDKYDRILGLEKTPYMATVAAALGYRHAEDATQFAKKSRFPLGEVIQDIS